MRGLESKPQGSSDQSTLLDAFAVVGRGLAAGSPLPATSGDVFKGLDEMQPPSGTCPSWSVATLRGGSEPVDEDIDASLDLVAGVAQRAQRLAEFAQGHGGDLLESHDPTLALELDDRGDVREARVDPGLAEGRDETRRVR